MMELVDDLIDAAVDNHNMLTNPFASQADLEVSGDQFEEAYKKLYNALKAELEK